MIFWCAFLSVSCMCGVCMWVYKLIKPHQITWNKVAKIGCLFPEGIPSCWFCTISGPDHISEMIWIFLSSDSWTHICEIKTRAYERKLEAFWTYCKQQQNAQNSPIESLPPIFLMWFKDKYRWESQPCFKRFQKQAFCYQIQNSRFNACKPRIFYIF